MDAERWILVVDDDKNHREMLGEALGRAGFLVDLAAGGEEAIEKGGCREYDAVFSDIKMSPLSGIDVLEAFRKTAPDTPVVLLTAFGSVDTAIQAMKQGAFDYISKPVNLDELVMIAARTAEHRRLVRENRHLRLAYSERVRAVSIIGQSRRMVEVFKLVGKVAHSRAAILIQGESGTGKELVARAIHDNSPRAAHPFVAVNCSAIPGSLFESELFGHIKGAFTGADAFRRGLLEESSGGTCFLDEVGDLSPAGQAKLLRTLQEREIRRVGSNETIPVDLRVIAASRRDLQQVVKTGHFREDLLYRLNTVTITLPSLRERPEDIPLLAECFLARYGAEKENPPTGLTSDAMQALLQYSWPGNVRELEHVVERAVALANHAILSVDDFPLEVVNENAASLAEASEGAETIDALKRDRVVAVLESTKGDKEQAARLLGVSKRTIYRLIDRYGLEKKTASPPGDSLDKTIS
jgi:two-component system, NtrC family, response regulator AtoC